MRILYLLHISWFWIKQRPQFLAEELSQYYPVTVACLEDYGNQAALDACEKPKGLSLRATRKIREGRWGNWLTPRLNFWWKQRQLKKLLETHSWVWVTSPQQFQLIQPYLRQSHRVIYDCMDDHAEFYSAPNVRSRIRDLERALCLRAHLIFASASLLAQRIHERYQPTAQVVVLNNAIRSSVLDARASEPLPDALRSILADKAFRHIVYIGTVAHWIDFDLIVKTLNQFPSIRVVLIGPTDTSCPLHERLIIAGKIEHASVATAMQSADALFMPFQVTDLIRAVNPVKAYEYIASGKPVILSDYEETLPFQSYAYLYANEQAFFTLINRLINEELPPLVNQKEAIEFAMQHTWDRRGQTIQAYLDACQ